MADCVRGCTAYRRHLQSCPVQDHASGAWVASGLDDDQRDELMDGDRALLGSDPRAGVWIGRYGGLEVWRDCRGCLPREAAHGRLCEHCHGRLVEWLQSVGALYRWLSVNIAPGTAAGAKQDWQRPAAADGAPAPVRIAVLDVRNLLVDRLLELEDCARDVFDRPPRQGRFSLARAALFLEGWLSRLEDDEDLVAHAFELLEDLFRRARSVAPWEDRPRRITGIICPQCEQATLEVRPGMEDVTCRTCRAVIPKQRYEIWTRILADEASGGRAS